MKARTLFSIRVAISLLLAFMLAPTPSLTAAQKNDKKNGKNIQAAAGPPLTLEAISRDAGKWVGTAPTGIRWAEDGSKLHFQWNPDRADRAELYELDLNSKDAKPRKVGDDEKRWLSSNPGDRNKADKLKVYAFQGDLYLLDLSSGKTRAITRTSDAESNARFSADDRSVIYQRGDNLFEWVIETGETTQLSDFRRGKDPEEKPKLSKQDEDLEKEQMELFDIVRKQDKEEKEQKERTRRERGSFPEPTYLKENETVSSLQLSPDRKSVTFILTDRTESGKAKVPEMPKYVTKSGYTETERLGTQIAGAGRVKVGAAQVKQKLGVASTATGKITYLDMGLDRREFGFQVIGGADFGTTGGSAVVWSDDGKNAFSVMRSRDNKDRWIALIDVANAKAKIIDSEHDDAWVLTVGPFGWLDDQTLWYRSERDGYFHLYTLSITDPKPKALTAGKWEITAAQLSKDKKRFYITTSEPHPGERQFYWLAATGGERTRITTGEGVNAVAMSPDEKWLALSYSSSDQPSDLYLTENKPGATARRLTDSYTDEFKSYTWRKFELVTIPDADKNMLYARLYRPERPDPNRPAVIYVHGAGYAQSVFKNWGGAGTTPFFNVLLQAGYTVLDLDYRGSSGYGRDCRTAIYRNMGGKDIDSAVAAARWLSTTAGIDARRIGIYGGSYGGFFTLMALFKHPGVFAAGAAMYPVTDWAHYNHPYTSNILNLPYEDEKAYEQSSPIYYASGLQDRLLILHGMHDRNVHYQDTIRLAQRLIELKKAGWELATMPVEDHGWQNEFSRLDSNRRIFGLFEEVLKRPLPPMTAERKSPEKTRATTN
jgi:dipeptidyl aminopeptidase/acylaminoacyl peptidase